MVYIKYLCDNIRSSFLAFMQLSTHISHMRAKIENYRFDCETFFGIETFFKIIKTVMLFEYAANQCCAIHWFHFGLQVE